jgi:alpha/beta hydrolase family protein
MKSFIRLHALHGSLVFLIIFGVGLRSQTPSPRATTFVVPLPEVTPIAVTASSHPWLYYKATQRPLPLDAKGFVEEEFLVRGTANVYDWPADAAQDLIVKYRGAPYATRVLIRRPADLSKFSGTVLVEVMNPARGFDMAIMHGFLSDSMLERGDAWVGISTPGVIESLKRFDASRYATLSFANPAPADVVCAAGGGRGGRGGRSAGEGATPAAPGRNPVEAGLRLDAFAQIGRWVRGAAGNPLSGSVRTVFLVGHTGGDVATYISSVGRDARLDNGKPVYDGYIAHSGSNAGALMNCGAALAAGDLRAIPGRAGVPVVVMKTQTDLPYVGRADSDAAGDVFRIYDIPGSAHADKWLFRYLPTVAEQRKATDVMTRTPVTDEWPFDLTCDIPDIRMNDFPQGYLVAGAVANLEKFARDGMPLPKAPRVVTELVGGVTTVKLDQYGNAIGGVRSPFVDVPTGTFHAKLTGALSTCADMTYHEVWDWWKTAAVYGTYENYAARVNASIDAMLRGRWITDAAAKRLRAELLRQVPKANHEGHEGHEDLSF